MIYNTNVDIVNDDVCTNFGLILSICSQDIEKKKTILALIKGRNAVAYLQNMMIYHANVDLVNDDVNIKFGLN